MIIHKCSVLLHFIQVLQRRCFNVYINEVTGKRSMKRLLLSCSFLCKNESEWSGAVHRGAVLRGCFCHYVSGPVNASWLSDGAFLGVCGPLESSLGHSREGRGGEGREHLTVCVYSTCVCVCMWGGGGGWGGVCLDVMPDVTGQTSW